MKHLSSRSASEFAQAVATSRGSSKEPVLRENPQMLAEVAAGSPQSAGLGIELDWKMLGQRFPTPAGASRRK
ncbi:MAG TPA: hypothetical protein VM120_28665 [Bryobacteraceae bacterium]|nr:hypothetical protein [Bryobacteraceae bacterium]